MARAISQKLASLYPAEVGSACKTVSRSEFKNLFRDGEYSPVYGELTVEGGLALLEHAFSQFQSSARPALVDLGSGIGRFCVASVLSHGDRLREIHGVELSRARHELACEALAELNSRDPSKASLLKFHSMNILEFPLTLPGPVLVYCASLTFSADVITALQDRIERQCVEGSLIYTCREFSESFALNQVDTIAVETSWSPNTALHVYSHQ